MPRGDGEQADLALALGKACRRALDPVVDGVADDVGERIADRLDHLAVQLHVAAVKVDHHLLAELGRKVADKAGQRAEQSLDPLHPHPRDRVAHVGEDGGEALERPIDGRLVARLPQPVGKIVARQHHVGHAAHHAVEQFDRQADGALVGAAEGGGLLLAPTGPSAELGGSGGVERGLGAIGRGLGAARERCDQRIVTALRKDFVRFDGVDHRRDPVDDREHSGHQRFIGLAASGAAIGERVLGGMAEAGEAGEIEEAAIALHRVDEAEDRIETRAVGRIGFPGDEFAAGGLQHLAGLGDEFRQQVVHACARPLSRVRQASRRKVGTGFRLFAMRQQKCVSRAMRQGWLISP